MHTILWVLFRVYILRKNKVCMYVRVWVCVYVCMRLCVLSFTAVWWSGSSIEMNQIKSDQIRSLIKHEPWLPRVDGVITKTVLARVNINMPIFPFVEPVPILVSIRVDTDMHQSIFSNYQQNVSEGIHHFVKVQEIDEWNTTLASKIPHRKRFLAPKNKMQFCESRRKLGVWDSSSIIFIPKMSLENHMRDFSDKYNGVNLSCPFYCYGQRSWIEICSDYLQNSILASSLASI